MSLLKILCITLLLMASNYTLADRGYYYGGLKAGALVTSMDGFDSAYPLGVRVGYDYGGRWSLELDFLTGNFTQGFEASADGLSEELDVSTQALNITYRSETDIYYIIRFGIIDEEIANSSKFNFSGVNNTGFSIGTGAGYRLSDKVSLEFEYTYVESELDFFGFTIQRRLWSKKTPW